MTYATNSAPLRAALPAATLAALLLAGCSSGNIGESWQCPLAKGGSCDSVAAADPAVPDPDAAGNAVLGEPLWRVRAAETDTPPAHGPGQAAETPCSEDCDGVFDPFGWLARLFAAEADEGETRPAGQPEPATAAKTETLPAGPNREAGPAGSLAAPETAEPRLAEPAVAALPAEPAGAESGPQADDLRTGEVVARIWIAPFVDAGGAYREASYIRVVLEPAGWRLK